MKYADKGEFFLSVGSDYLRVVHTEQDIIKESVSIPHYDTTTEAIYTYYSTIHKRVAEFEKIYPLWRGWCLDFVLSCPAENEGYGILAITRWTDRGPDSWVSCWNEESDSLFLVSKDRVRRGSYSLDHRTPNKNVAVCTCDNEVKARDELMKAIQKRRLRDELTSRGRHV